jgi:hypothetical protein
MEQLTALAKAGTEINPAFQHQVVQLFKTELNVKLIYSINRLKFLQWFRQAVTITVVVGIVARG